MAIKLKEQLEYKQDLTMQEESETFEIFSDLYSKREEAIFLLDLKGEKLVKLGVSKQKLMQLKESNKLGQQNQTSVPFPLSWILPKPRPMALLWNY